MKVYQVNIGGYDKEHPHTYEGDFYYVTEGQDSRRAKCVPPFPVSGDVVLYIDGAFEIIKPIEGWAEQQLSWRGEWDIVFNVHSVSGDCYEEADYCLSKGKGDPTIIDKQIADYRAEGVPEGGNLAMGGIFIFRDTEKVREFLLDWYDEYQKYPSRDQIALHKIRDKWKDDIRIGWMNPYEVCKLSKQHGFTYHFEYHPHNETRPKVYYLTAWSTSKNIGRVLNEHIECLPDNCWVGVMDGDAAFMTPYWGKQIEDAIMRYPDTELFGCYTNRIGLNYQTVDGRISDNYDADHHRKLAEDRARKYWSECHSIDSTVAGFFMCFKKSTWEKNRFPDELFDKQARGGSGALFDYTFCEYFVNNKLPIRLIKGLYMFHFYRMGKENPRQQIVHLL